MRAQVITLTRGDGYERLCVHSRLYGRGLSPMVAAFFCVKQAGLGSLLQVWRLKKSCSWSKASWLGRLAPSVKRKKKIGLEQERKKKRFAPNRKK